MGTNSDLFSWSSCSIHSFVGQIEEEKKDCESGGEGVEKERKENERGIEDIKETLLSLSCFSPFPSFLSVSPVN